MVGGPKEPFLTLIHTGVVSIVLLILDITQKKRDEAEVKFAWKKLCKIM
jgi:hypothetical protein